MFALIIKNIRKCMGGLHRVAYQERDSRTARKVGSQDLARSEEGLSRVRIILVFSTDSYVKPLGISKRFNTIWGEDGNYYVA
jgi:hypothetical protein